MTTTTTDRLIAGPKVLRPREVSALLAQPDARRWRGRRDRALLAVMALGGLRVGEAVRLTRDNVELARGGAIRLTFAGAKSGATRTVTLPPSAARALRTWLADPRCGRWWVFQGRRGEHLTVRAAQLALDRHSRAALGRHLKAHALRHTCGSMIAWATSDIRKAQVVLGHRDIRTTARFYAAYTVRDADDAAAALERELHPEGGAPRVRRAPRRAA
jgi:integrase